MNAFEMRKISLRNNQEFKQIYKEIERISKLGLFEYTYTGTISPGVSYSLTKLHYRVITKPIKEPITTDKIRYIITISW